MSICPLVTVLLPVYNAEPYIEACIDSILEQTYSNLEILIINDGSTDNTLDLINEYDDERITVLSHPNVGLIQTLNKGLELAKGSYIVRMDADDMMIPSRIALQVKFMEENETIGASGGNMETFDDRGNVKFVSNPVSPEELVFYSLKSVPIFHPTAIIRSSVIRTNDIRYDENYPHAEDAGFWLEIMKVSALANIKSVVLKYRISDGQVSKVFSDEQGRSVKKVRHRTFDYINEKYGVNLSECALERLPKNVIYHYYYCYYLVVLNDSIGRLLKAKIIFGSLIEVKHKLKLLKYLFFPKYKS